MTKVGPKELARRAMREAQAGEGVVGASAQGSHQLLAPSPLPGPGNTEAGGARSAVDAVMAAKGKATVRSVAGAPDAPFDRKAYQREYMRGWRKRKKGDG